MEFANLLSVLSGGQGEPGGSEGDWLDRLHEQAMHRQPNQHFTQPGLSNLITEPFIWLGVHLEQEDVLGDGLGSAAVMTQS